MWTKIAEKILSLEDINLVASIDKDNSSLLEQILKETKPDVLIDFTNASACVENVKNATKAWVNVIIWTTGFTDKQLQEIKDAIEKNNVWAIMSSNFAVWVNIFWNILKKMSKYLQNSQIKITEIHHINKKDAPSWTALTAKEVIEKSVWSFKEIDVESIREWDEVWDHKVRFNKGNEFLELRHKALDREVFVDWVIEAVRYIVDAEKWKISDMNDVLNLN